MDSVLKTKNTNSEVEFELKTRYRVHMTQESKGVNGGFLALTVHSQQHILRWTN